MSKPARGIKRVCQNCGTRFYDLGRTPIVCPACQTMYQATQPTSRRGERAAPPPEATEKEEEAEVETVTLETPETISLEEVEEGGEDVPIEEEEIVDLGEDEAEIPAGDDDSTFLEEPEGDEEADVSGIVSGPEQGEEG
jgi:uncharacterized protein (TIGR02300 family)